jgi:hypothetical protein
MDRAARYLEAYSNRELSYDTDALDAIAGALDPLRKDSVHHIWGTLFRYDFENTNTFLRLTEGTIFSLCSACTTWDSSTYTIRRSAAQGKTDLDPISADVLPNPQDVERLSEIRNFDQSALPACRISMGQMALTWYHKTPGRHRHGFPSWSLEWAGPLSWYQQNFNSEQSSIVLNHVCNVKLHFPKLSGKIPNCDPAQAESLDSTPPTMEIPLRTVHLGLVLDHNNYQVIINLDSDYKSIIEVH